jgi:hypothetical protein
MVLARLILSRAPFLPRRVGLQRNKSATWNAVVISRLFSDTADIAYRTQLVITHNVTRYTWKYSPRISHLWAKFRTQELPNLKFGVLTHDTVFAEQ